MPHWASICFTVFLFAAVARAQEVPQRNGGDGCDWYCWIEERIARLEGYLVSFVWRGEQGEKGVEWRIE